MSMKKRQNQNQHDRAYADESDGHAHQSIRKAGKKNFPTEFLRLFLQIKEVNQSLELIRKIDVLDQHGLRH